MLQEEDFQIGRAALELNFITKEQLEECILVYQAKEEAGIHKRLEEIMVENQLINRNQLRELYRFLGRNRLGKYEIVEKIARGSTSTVYRARNEENDQIVALKILLPKLNDKKEFRTRFIREGKALTLFDHPNIVKVFEVGKEKNRHFIAMEFIKGMTLSDFLKEQKGQLDERFALELGLQIALALECIHSHDFIHRDVKPQNIILTPEGTIKLMDLGLTKKMGEASITQTGSIMGTPLYISPEQIEGSKSDKRTDIYAFGATLYHLLAGRPPFQGKGPSEVMNHHLETPPRPPNQLNPSLSQKASDMVLTMLAKPPQKRPSSFREIIEDLRKMVRIDLSVEEEAFTEEVSRDLIRDSHPTLAAVFDPREKKETPTQKGNIFNRLIKEIFDTRWDVITLFILLAIVLIGGIFVYRIYSTAPQEVDIHSYIESAQKESRTWQLDKFQKTLEDLYRKEGTGVLEEDLEKIFQGLRKNFLDLAGKYNRDYHGLEELETLRGQKVIFLYKYLKSFGKKSLNRKCNQAIGEAREILRELERKQYSLYEKKMATLKAQRKYQEAFKWHKKNLSVISTEGIRQEIKDSEKKIQNLLNLSSRLKEKLQKGGEKRELQTYYFRQNQIKTMTVKNFEDSQLAYVVKKIRPFSIDPEGKLDKGQAISVYREVGPLPFQKFLERLHTLSLVELFKREDGYNQILRFLLGEKRTNERDLLVKTYLNQAISQGFEVNEKLLAEAREVVNSRLDYAALSHFKEFHKALWKGRLEKAQSTLAQLQLNFSQTSWFKKHKEAMERGGKFLSLMNLFREKNWEKCQREMEGIKGKEKPLPGMKEFERNFQAFRLYLQATLEKLNWKYSSSRKKWETFLQDYNQTLFYKNNWRQGVANWNLTTSLEEKGLYRSPQQNHLKQLLEFLKKGSQNSLSGEALKSIVAFLDTLARAFSRLPRIEKEKIEDLVKVLKIESGSPGDFAPLGNREKECMKIFAEIRLASTLEKRKVLASKIKAYEDTDFYQTYRGLIWALFQLRGKLQPLERDLVQISYTFQTSSELADWESRGWGPYRGHFYFLKANENELLQNPLGYQRLKALEEVERWKITIQPQAEFAFLISLSQLNYLFFRHGGSLYFDREVSLEKYYDLKRKEELHQIQETPLLKGLSTNLKPLDIKLNFSSSKIEVATGSQSSARQQIFNSSLQSLYLWLTPGSGISKVTIQSKIKPYFD